MNDKEIIREQANIDISNLCMAQEQGIITEFGKGKLEALEGIVDFIDSLQEGPVIKGLEETAIKAFKEIVDTNKNNFLEIFKAGANWQKEQIMKEAIDTTIKQGCTDLGVLIKGLDKGKFSFGDKVKVIIIKSE